MKNPTYYNGIISPFEAASIPLFDRSFFFADAVYDVMIGRNKKVYQYSEHMQRLRKNCDATGLSLLYTDTDISQIITELTDISDYDEFMVYIHVSGRSERRAHRRDGGVGNLFISLTQISLPRVPNTLSAKLIPDKRYDYCNIKTTNLLPSVLSLSEVGDDQTDIAIFHRDCRITEASYANVFICKNEKLLTPPLSNRLLPGITRSNIIKLSAKVGIACEEKEISTQDLLDADEIFFSSTTKLVQQCNKISGYERIFEENKLVKRVFSLLLEDFLRYTT